MAGTVSATSQTMTSTTADPGQTCRTPNVAPNNSAHAIATARTGVSVLRPSLVAPRTRSASRAMIATNSPIVSEHARGADEFIDDPRLVRDGHERVGRTVRAATHPRGRRLIRLHEQRRREVEQHDEQPGRRRQRAIHMLREATGREREDQVDQRRLDAPVHHSPGAVEHGVVGQRECDCQNRRAGGHQQPPETLERRASPCQQPHRHRYPHCDRARGSFENDRRRRCGRQREQGSTPSPTATAAPIPTMSSRFELRTAGPSSTQARNRSTHRRNQQAGTAPAPGLRLYVRHLERRGVRARARPPSRARGSRAKDGAGRVRPRRRGRGRRTGRSGPRANSGLSRMYALDFAQSPKLSTCSSTWLPSGSR